MKEKHKKNGCNILIMTFTNLEKYVSFKKWLRQRRQPPYPSLQQSRRYHFAPKKSPGYGCYLQLNMPIQQIE